MRTTRLLLVASVFATTACREPPPENNEGCTEDWFVDFIRADPPAPVGDLSCFTAGSLSADSADAACQTEVSLAATVVDYEKQEAVADVSLSLFAGDDPGASGGVDATSDVSGLVDTAIQACTPFAYKTSRPEAMDTYGPHVVIGHEAPIEKNFQSVANGSRSLIEIGLQIEISAGNGAVVGVVRGCDEEPLLGAQVIVRDASCSVPSSWIPGYFTNQIPDAFRAETSDDGVYAGMDMPPGEYIADAYILEDGALVLLGSSPVEVRADSVTVTDVHAGRPDGVKMPDSCTSCG